MGGIEGGRETEREGGWEGWRVAERASGREGARGGGRESERLRFAAPTLSWPARPPVQPRPPARPPALPRALTLARPRPMRTVFGGCDGVVELFLAKVEGGEHGEHAADVGGAASARARLDEIKKFILSAIDKS